MCAGDEMCGTENSEKEHAYSNITPAIPVHELQTAGIHDYENVLDFICILLICFHH